MATIDLGKIKLVWRGTYAGGTAYTVDDVVSHTDSGIVSSYICTTNSTGNAPSTGGSVHGSWAYLAKGASAYTSTLTTQGDILYRDGSGEARLGYGTAGQVLQTGGSGANPSWGTVSSDYVKLSTIEPSANSTGNVVFDNLFDDTTYLYYICAWDNVSLHSGSNMGMRFRFLNSSGAELTGSLYRGGCMAHYIHGSASTTHIHRDWNDAELNMFADNISLTADNNRGWTGEIKIFQPQSTVHKTIVQGHTTGDDGAGGSIWDSSMVGYYNDGSSGSIVNRGFKIFGSDVHTFAAGSRWTLYGVKK